MKEIFYDFGGFNKAIFLTLNHITNHYGLPYFLKYISSIFNIANFAFLYFALCIYQYIKLRNMDPRILTQAFTIQYNKLVHAGICYAIFGFTYAFLKFYINIPRPFCSLPTEAFSTIIDTSFERCLSSFPSAHTGLAIMVSYLLWQYLTIRMKFIAIITIFITALSRITLAMHYPADIFYSIFIVLFVILIANITFTALKNNLLRYFEVKIKDWLF